MPAGFTSFPMSIRHVPDRMLLQSPLSQVCVLFLIQCLQCFSCCEFVQVWGWWELSVTSAKLSYAIQENV